MTLCRAFLTTPCPSSGNGECGPANGPITTKVKGGRSGCNGIHATPWASAGNYGEEGWRTIWSWSQVIPVESYLVTFFVVLVAPKRTVKLWRIHVVTTISLVLHHKPYASRSTFVALIKATVAMGTMHCAPSCLFTWFSSWANTQLSGVGTEECNNCFQHLPNVCLSFSLPIRLSESCVLTTCTAG